MADSICDTINAALSAIGQAPLTDRERTIARTLVAATSAPECSPVDVGAVAAPDGWHATAAMFGGVARALAPSEEARPTGAMLADAFGVNVALSEYRRVEADRDRLAAENERLVERVREQGAALHDANARATEMHRRAQTAEGIVAARDKRAQSPAPTPDDHAALLHAMAERIAPRGWAYERARALLADPTLASTEGDKQALAVARSGK